jgi:hypothetical protein
MQHEHSQKINNCKVKIHLSDQLKTFAIKNEAYKYLKARTYQTNHYHAYYSCDPKRIYTWKHHLWRPRLQYLYQQCHISICKFTYVIK